MSDSLSVRGPYTDGTFSVVEQIGPRLVSRGFFRTRGLAEQRLFLLRDQRGGRG